MPWDPFLIKKLLKSDICGSVNSKWDTLVCTPPLILLWTVHELMKVYSKSVEKSKTTAAKKKKKKKHKLGPSRAKRKRRKTPVSLQSKRSHNIRGYPRSFLLPSQTFVDPTNCSSRCMFRLGFLSKFSWRIFWKLTNVQLYFLKNKALKNYV